MRILKKAEQKNIILNKDYYNKREISEMLTNLEIFQLDGTIEEYRISTSNLKELKVALEDGFYINIAVGKNGKEYKVIL